MDTTVKRDYYDVLGVARDADAKAIRDAFRTLALQYHPDRNKEPGAEERFKEIAEAYAVLSDPAKRRDYDAGGFGGLGGLSAEDLFGGIDFEDLLRGAGLHFGGPDFGSGLFDRLFGMHRRRGPPRGRDIALRIEVPLERIAGGGEHTVHVPRTLPCAACSGSGARDGKVRPCEACRGSGRDVKTTRQDGVTLSRSGPCPACAGRGHFIDVPCPACNGAGSTEEVQTLTLKVPVGIEEGAVLRVPGHGMPIDGGAPGDLMVAVHSASDARFVRDGADLWRVEQVGVADAVLGIEREVPTLDASTVVRVPAGTQPDTVLRVRGQGLPRFGGHGRGDLMVRIQVCVPTALSAEERRLYRRLQELPGNARGE